MEKRFFQNVFRKEWLLDLHEQTVLTRKVLLDFFVPELETEFVNRLVKNGVKVEKVSRLDPRLNKYNCIEDELTINPGKKIWHIVKTSSLKKALISMGGTRISTEMKKHYQEMEDCVRKAFSEQERVQNTKELVTIAVEEASKKFTEIIIDRFQ